MTLTYWNDIYEHFNPIAFHIFSLLSALYIAKYFIKKDKLDFNNADLDIYFVYAELGVILGARLGYILVYDPETSYYLVHPWQIFNPFVDGKFIGIRGMSYHGAIFGFLIGTYIFTRKYKVSFGKLMDLVAISIPLAYVFGRLGNFLNQQLVGRPTDVPWGIYVDGVLRHPSQLYEAFLEGICVFIVVYIYRKHKKFNGELILVYGFSYGIFRSIAEFFRAPDPQIGYLCCHTVTLGMVLSLSMSLLSLILWVYFYKKDKK